MKKLTVFLAVLAICSFGVFAAKNECTAIQSGTLVASDGSTIEAGYDIWGYNYQAHMFSGGYCDAYRDASWCQPYEDVKLLMKWNDAWISNRDCNNDGLLDRHFGFNSYVGSGAWLTNHQSGQYEQDGQTCKWEYFTKIAAKPTADYDCEEIGGEEIWGEFCTVLTVSNDKCYGDHGQVLKADVPGLGFY